MAPEVVEVWRADDRAAEEHVHATLAIRSGVEDVHFDSPIKGGRPDVVAG
jgi:hypothetical protein